MKSAREPPSSRPTPYASLKTPHESCPIAAPCGPRRISFSLINLPVNDFDSRTQGFSTPLARRRSSCPPPSPNLMRTQPIERYQALRDSALCLLRATTPPERHQIGARKRRALGTPSSANHTAAASQPTVYKEWYRAMSKRRMKLPYSISRATSIDLDCCHLPTASALSNKEDKPRSD